MAVTSGFVEAPGGRLHYLRWHSDGPPLVIVHGNSHCGGVYEPLAERLAPDFDVIAVDLMGHGLSDKPQDPAFYSWASLRYGVLGLFDALELDGVVLAGHSRGGGVSLLTAAAAPERVRCVVVYEPTVTLLMRELQAAAGSSLAERASRLSEQAANRRNTFPDRRAMYDHFQGRGAFKFWQDEFLRAYVAHGAIESPTGGLELACPPRVEGALYHAMTDATEWTKIDGCTVPVLAIYGEHGGRLRPGHDPVAGIRPLFPAITTTVFEGCTHSGPMERPDLFERSIRDFAERHTTSGISEHA